MDRPSHPTSPDHQGRPTTGDPEPGATRPRGILPPGLKAWRTYRRGWLRGDVLAGVTVAAYLIPQVMAYADVAGLPAVAGIWAAAAALLVYAVLGSSPQLSVGPESTTALMTATALAGMAPGQPARYAMLAATLACLVGVICLLAWTARLGFVADLLSRPVLVGYLTGVALLMMASQVGKLTGLTVTGDRPWAQLSYVVDNWHHINLATGTLSGVLLGVLLLASRRWPKTPVPLSACWPPQQPSVSSASSPTVSPWSASSRTGSLPSAFRSSPPRTCGLSCPLHSASQWWRSPTTC